MPLVGERLTAQITEYPPDLIVIVQSAWRYYPGNGMTVEAYNPTLGPTQPVPGNMTTQNGAPATYHISRPGNFPFNVRVTYNSHYEAGMIYDNGGNTPVQAPAVVTLGVHLTPYRIAGNRLTLTGPLGEDGFQSDFDVVCGGILGPEHAAAIHGSIATLQLVRSRRRVTIYGLPPIEATTNGEWYLDADGADDTPWYSGPVALPSNISADDSPEMLLLPDYAEVSIEDEFQLYVMYRPPALPAGPSIWVALGYLPWRASARARNQAGGWVLVEHAEHAGAFTPSYDLPRWNSNMIGLIGQFTWNIRLALFLRKLPPVYVPDKPGKLFIGRENDRAVFEQHRVYYRGPDQDRDGIFELVEVASGCRPMLTRAGWVIWATPRMAEDAANAGLKNFVVEGPLPAPLKLPPRFPGRPWLTDTSTLLIRVAPLCFGLTEGVQRGASPFWERMKTISPELALDELRFKTTGPGGWGRLGLVVSCVQPMRPRRDGKPGEEAISPGMYEVLLRLNPLETELMLMASLPWVNTIEAK